MKTSEELHHYISVCANIQTPDKGSRLPSDALAAHGCSMVCWRLDDQDGFADSPYSNVEEARHCWRKSSWRIDSAVPKNGTSPCGILSIICASNWLRQYCKASKLVCRSSSLRRLAAHD